MQNFIPLPYGFGGPFDEPSDQNKHVFPIVTQLPGGVVRLGTVVNGRHAGPVFHIPDYPGSGLEHVGVFGGSGLDKTCILMAIAVHTMLNGNLAWMFDAEDEFSCLVDAVPEPYKPVVITPEHLKINFFQPPGDQIRLVSWLEIIAFLLRSETFLRDGSQNLFNASLRQLLKNKGAFAGSGQYPSLAEILRYLQDIKLGESEVRDNAYRETLINRMTTLCDAYEQSAHVTNSDMLKLLANKSVIFRLHKMRKTPLQFLTKFLLIRLNEYRKGVTNTKRLQTLFLDGQCLLRADRGRNDTGGAILENIFASGAKRALRIVLSNQIISNLNNHILGHMGCRIIARLTSPQDILFIQQSMGLSHAQARSIPQLKRGEVVVSYGGHPKPFKVRIDKFLFPLKQNEVVLERNAQAFLGEVAWSKDSALKNKQVESDAITGHALKVLIRIAEVVETVKERCEGLKMDRACEFRARAVLEANPTFALGR